MSFNFDPKESWEVSTGTMLQKGNHACDILEIDSVGTSSGGHPQVEVKVGNPDGDIRDWIVISSPKTFGKFTALVLAAGVPEAEWPKAGEDFDVQTGRVNQAYCDSKLRGRKVGVVVRDEARQNDPSKVGPRVQGYVPVAAVTAANGGGVPIDTAGLSDPQPAGGQQAGGKLPFRADPFVLDFEPYRAEFRGL